LEIGVAFSDVRGSVRFFSSGLNAAHGRPFHHANGRDPQVHNLGRLGRRMVTIVLFMHAMETPAQLSRSGLVQRIVKQGYRSRLFLPDISTAHGTIEPHGGWIDSFTVKYFPASSYHLVEDRTDRRQRRGVIRGHEIRPRKVVANIADKHPKR